MSVSVSTENGKNFFNHPGEEKSLCQAIVEALQQHFSKYQHLATEESSCRLYHFTFFTARDFMLFFFVLYFLVNVFYRIFSMSFWRDFFMMNAASKSFSSEFPKSFFWLNSIRPEDPGNQFYWKNPPKSDVLEVQKIQILICLGQKYFDISQHKRVLLSRQILGQKSNCWHCFNNRSRNLNCSKVGIISFYVFFACYLETLFMVTKSFLKLLCSKVQLAQTFKIHQPHLVTQR